MRELSPPVIGLLGLSALGLLVLAVQQLTGGPRKLKRQQLLVRVQQILFRHTTPERAHAILAAAAAMSSRDQTPQALAELARQHLSPEELAAVEADPALLTLFREHVTP